MFSTVAKESCSEADRIAQVLTPDFGPSSPCDAADGFSLDNETPTGSKLPSFSKANVFRFINPLTPHEAHVSHASAKTAAVPVKRLLVSPLAQLCNSSFDFSVNAPLQSNDTMQSSMPLRTSAASTPPVAYGSTSQIITNMSPITTKTSALPTTSMSFEIRKQEQEFARPTTERASPFLASSLSSPARATWDVSSPAPQQTLPLAKQEASTPRTQEAASPTTQDASSPTILETPPPAAQKALLRTTRVPPASEERKTAKPQTTISDHPYPAKVFWISRHATEPTVQHGWRIPETCKGPYVGAQQQLIAPTTLMSASLPNETSPKKESFEEATAQLKQESAAHVVKEQLSQGVRTPPSLTEKCKTTPLTTRCAGTLGATERLSRLSLLPQAVKTCQSNVLRSVSAPAFRKEQPNIPKVEQQSLKTASTARSSSINPNNIPTPEQQLVIYLEESKQATSVDAKVLWGHSTVASRTNQNAISAPLSPLTMSRSASETRSRFKATQISSADDLAVPISPYKATVLKSILPRGSLRPSRLTSFPSTTYEATTSLWLPEDQQSTKGVLSYSTLPALSPKTKNRTVYLTLSPDSASEQMAALPSSMTQPECSIQKMKVNHEEAFDRGSVKLVSPSQESGASLDILSVCSMDDFVPVIPERAVFRNLQLTPSEATALKIVQPLLHPPNESEKDVLRLVSYNQGATLRDLCQHWKEIQDWMTIEYPKATEEYQRHSKVGLFYAFGYSFWGHPVLICRASMLQCCAAPSQLLLAVYTIERQLTCPDVVTDQIVLLIDMEGANCFGESVASLIYEIDRRSCGLIAGIFLVRCDIAAYMCLTHAHPFRHSLRSKIHLVAPGYADLSEYIGSDQRECRYGGTVHDMTRYDASYAGPLCNFPVRKVEPFGATLPSAVPPLLPCKRQVDLSREMTNARNLLDLILDQSPASAVLHWFATERQLFCGATPADPPPNILPFEEYSLTQLRTHLHQKCRIDLDAPPVSTFIGTPYDVDALLLKILYNVRGDLLQAQDAFITYMKRKAEQSASTEECNAAGTFMYQFGVTRWNQPIIVIRAAALVPLSQHEAFDRARNLLNVIQSTVLKRGIVEQWVFLVDVTNVSSVDGITPLRSLLASIDREFPTFTARIFFFSDVANYSRFIPQQMQRKVISVSEKAALFTWIHPSQLESQFGGSASLPQTDNPFTTPPELPDLYFTLPATRRIFPGLYCGSLSDFLYKIAETCFGIETRLSSSEINTTSDNAALQQTKNEAVDESSLLSPNVGQQSPSVTNGNPKRQFSESVCLHTRLPSLSQMAGMSDTAANLPSSRFPASMPPSGAESPSTSTLASTGLEMTSDTVQLRTAILPVWSSLKHETDALATASPRKGAHHTPLASAVHSLVGMTQRNTHPQPLKLALDGPKRKSAFAKKPEQQRRYYGYHKNGTFYRFLFGGDSPELTEFETAALQATKAQFFEKGIALEGTVFEKESELLRFLQSSKWDPGLCVHRVLSHLEWRGNTLPVTPEDVAAVRDPYICHVAGRDRRLRPILTCRLRALSETDYLAARHYIVATLEEVLRVLLKPGDIEQWTVIADAHDFSVFNLFSSSAKAYLKEFQDNYPERLHKLYIINGTNGFRLFWNLSIAPTLSPSTRRKVVLLDHNYFEALRRDVSRSQLLEIFPVIISTPR